MKLTGEKQKQLLQKDELVIAPHVQRGVMKRRRLTLKNCLAGTYLNVDDRQMEILALFRAGATVPEVLNDLVRRSKAPALRDFYELILKAYSRQILERTEDPLPEKEISSCRVPRIALWLLLPLLLSSCGFALWTMWKYPLIFLSHWTDLGWAILIASFCLSFGHILAGGVIRYFGGCVHRPSLKLLALPPHFNFDLNDTRLIHRGGAFFAGIARLLPFFPALGLVQLYQPSWTVPLLFLFILQIYPRRGSAMDQILQGLTGRVALDTAREKIFYLQKRSFLGKIADVLSEDFRYASVRTLFSLLWLVTLVVFGYRAFGDFLPVWWHEIPEEEVLYGLIAIFTFLSVFYPLFIVRRDFMSVQREAEKERKAKIKQEKRRRVYSMTNPPPLEERQAFLRDAPVCRPLDANDLEVLARESSFVSYAKKTFVFDEAEPDSDLKILFSGKVSVVRPSGRFGKEKLALLHSGVSIGKTSDWTEDRTPRKYLCAEKCGFLVVPRGESPKLDQVLNKIESSKVGIHLAFLARTPPFANWSPELLELLASEVSVHNFKKNQKVLQTEKPNKFFYIVHDGVLRFSVEGAKKRKQRVFKTGDFFGELSVLRNALPAGDVVGVEDGQCLTVGKSDFIRIMTQFPEAILEMERVASKTVGFPIFPVSEATARV